MRPIRIMKEKKINKNTIRKLLVDIIVDIIAGCLVGAGVYTFAANADLPLSGFTGISLIINKLTGFPIGTMIIILNIPVALLCYKVLGKRYFFNSMKSMAIVSLFIDFVAPLFPTVTVDKMLTAICTGVLCGIGYGLIYMRGSSSGGTDFITLSIKSKKPYLSIGRIAFMIDACIVLVGAIVVSKNITGMIYGLIVAYITSSLVDKLVYGLNSGKMTLIVTDKAEEVADAINDTVARGATFLKAQGSYTEENKNVVMCACSNKQMYLIKDAIKEVDPAAFMIVVDSSEVMGEGFEKRSSVL